MAQPSEPIWEAMRQRFAATGSVRAEDFIPADAGEELTLDILFAEYALRSEAGEVPDVAEFVQRFPTLAEKIERQIALHRAVADAAGEAPDIPGFPGFIPDNGSR